MTDEEKLEHIEKLRLIDDIFFEVFAQSREAVEEVLRVLLEDDGLTVERVVAQGNIRNLYGRSVRLDAACILGDGTRCDVEVQRAENEDHARRARFNASMLTVSESEPGDKFSDVKNVVVIYISETDVFREGKTAYHVKKTLAETETPFEDGLEEIFVNAAVNDGSRIAQLMECFMKPEFDEPKFPKTTARVNWLKQSEEGRNSMCEFSRLLIEEGAEERAIMMFINCLDDGMSVEKAKRLTELTDEQVQKALKMREEFVMV